MKTKTNSPAGRTTKSGVNQSRRQVGLFGLLALTLAAKAQEGSIFYTPPVEPIAPEAVRTAQTTNELEAFTPPPAPLTTPFKWGNFDFRPHLGYRFLQADGLPVAGTNHVSSSIQEISPGLLFDLGSHWALDYTPTWRLYSNKQFRDTVDHNAQLTGSTAYENWVFGLTQRYNRTSAPLVETGTQTDQEVYATALSASYQFNQRMSLDLGANQTFNSSTQFDSFREWSTLDWLNYQIRPRLSVALGAGFGYVNVDTGKDMTYEQIQARIAWRATDKISLSVHGGLEDRQFLNSGASDALNPIAGAAIQYQPFEFTKLSLNAEQTVTASLTTTGAQNQFAETSSFGGNLNQRLLQHFFLDFGGAYNQVSYVASGGPATNRKDDYYSLSVRLSTTFLKRGTVAGFYQISDYTSTQPGYTYTSHQFGFEIGYRY